VEVAILLEDDMEPVPEGVQIASDYGYITVRARYEGQPRVKRVPVSGTAFVHGRHVIVSGEEEALKAWLRPFEGVWVGRGSPILEQFDLMHVE
jgi:hypothetical protein